MADVELVIKIPKEEYEYLKAGHAKEVFYGDAIAKGIPLPKGHKKLIAEPTEEEIAETIGGKNDFADCIREAVKTVFANASAIIEADKEYGVEVITRGNCMMCGKELDEGLFFCKECEAKVKRRDKE